MRVTIPALLALTLSACAPPWQPSDRPTPWIAPGTRAVEYFRPVEHSESVWRDGNGRDYKVNDIQDEIQEFLFKTGMWERWPESNFRNDWGTQRIAPFRFTVVSVRPTVVLMTPFEFGSPEGRSLSELVAPIGDKACLGNLHIVNSLECDISAVYAPSMQWFSHDLKVTPTLIVWRDGRAEIPLGNSEVLGLTHDDAMVRTTRERPGG